MLQYHWWTAVRYIRAVFCATRKTQIYITIKYVYVPQIFRYLAKNCKSIIVQLCFKCVDKIPMSVLGLRYAQKRVHQLKQLWHFSFLILICFCVLAIHELCMECSTPRWYIILPQDTLHDFEVYFSNIRSWRPQIEKIAQGLHENGSLHPN